MKAIFRRLLLIPFALVAAGAALAASAKDVEVEKEISLGGYKYTMPGEGKVCFLHEDGLSDIPYETSVTVADYGIRSFSMPMAEEMPLSAMLETIYEDASPEEYLAAGINGYIVTGDSKAFVWSNDSTMYVIQCWGPDGFCNMVFESIERIDTVR